jgi:UPF0755 protein
MARKIIVVLFFGLGIGAFVLWPKISLYLNSTAKTANQTALDFYLSEPIPLKDLAIKLKESGILSSTSAFVSIGKHKEINEKNIAAGKYIIEANYPIKYLLNGFKINRLGNGNAEVEVEVVVPSVRFVEDMAQRISEQMNFSKEAFLDVVLSDYFMNENGFTAETLPSFFLPNTYRFYYDSGLDSFIAKMKKERATFWNEERLAKLKSAGLERPVDAHTLASIVYAEQSKLKEEWSTVAGLYLNRIKARGLLQSDPTFKFCWGKKLDKVQQLTNAHKAIDCPYNTYKYAGLPPGPINIPPVACVDAVLNFEKSNYYYMCAAPGYTGKHNFTNSYNEHLRNARIYQAWLRKELAKKR